MSKIPFSPDELKIVGNHVGPASFGTYTKKYNTPISAKENFEAMFRRDGSVMWIPRGRDILNLESRTNIDHIARGEVIDMGTPYTDDEKGGPDLFGIIWDYIPIAHGSMVRPGKPALLDANDWPEVIKFPDIDALNWDECKKLNSCLNETERVFKVTFQNGMFERLISFMDFEGAAMALIDDDQKDAVHALFSKLCDMYEAMITRYLECVNINGIMFHDDWGSQRAPFFSPAVVREMLVPYMSRLTKFCHDRGLWFEQHSCGKNEQLVPCMIEAGVDMWMPQVMNDVDMLREQYGDKIVFGVTAPDIPEGATDSDIDAMGKAFAEKYAPDMGTHPIVLSEYRTDPRFFEAVYKYSRQILASI